MNTLFWGGSGWDVSHHIPWLSTKDVLSPPEATLTTMYFLYLANMLPCSYCRESYTKFMEHLNLWKSITMQVRGVKTIMLHANIAKYVVKVHDCVNVKLNKPTHSDNWEHVALQPRTTLMVAAINFLMVVCWNFAEPSEVTEELASKYHFFLAYLFPSVLSIGDKAGDLSTSISSNALQYSDLQKGRPFLKKWAYQVVEKAASGYLLPFKSLDMLLEGFRARSHKCSKMQPEYQPGSIEPKGCM